MKRPSFMGSTGRGAVGPTRPKRNMSSSKVQSNEPTLDELLELFRKDPERGRERFFSSVASLIRARATRRSRRAGLGDLIQTTMIVDDVCKRLMGRDVADWVDADHVVAMACKAIPQVLLHWIRHYRCDTRDQRRNLELTEQFLSTYRLDARQFERLHEVLEDLGKFAPLEQQVVELRFFGNISEVETARILGESLRSVQRAWVRARCWIKKEIS